MVVTSLHPGSHARAGDGKHRVGCALRRARWKRPPPPIARRNWKCCAICTRAPRAPTARPGGERMTEYPSDPTPAASPDYVYEAYRSTHPARPAAAADLAAAHAQRAHRPGVRPQPDRRDRQRPDPAFRRAAAGRAHHRGRPGAGRRRPRRAECAGRDLAGQRGGTLPPLARQSSGAARSELSGRGTRRSPTTQATIASSPSSPARIRGAIITTPGVRRTSTFRCSAPRCVSRLVTQMYFPNDPLIPLDPDPQSHSGRGRAASAWSPRFDLSLTEPEWALGYRFDIVLRGRSATPFEEPAAMSLDSQRIADGRPVLQLRPHRESAASGILARDGRRRRAHSPGIPCDRWRRRAGAGRCA